MRLGGRPDLGHLTYCTNIHPGVTWTETAEVLRRHVPKVKAAVSPDAPMGVGLRLAAAAAEDLDDSAALADLRAILDETGTYVFTLNGFPYGAFHGARVKENVYAPDWSTPERLAYTNRLADLLAGLLPDGMTGSISTVPGTFKPWAEGRVEAIADNLVAHAAHLVVLARRTGKTIALAIEPEPHCLMETVEETVRFFEMHLFSRRAAERLGRRTGLSAAAAEEALRRHIGLCYDVCHAALAYEDARGSVAALRGAGIAVAKLQLSSALRLPRVDRETAEKLRPFDEPVYLHQVIERRGDRFRRFLDLPEALSEIDTAEGSEWRVHFHVPVFLADLPHFSTTQGFLAEILSLHRADPISAHLEAETYTWDVLPEEHRNVPVDAAIARELQWVCGRLAA